jgi:tetratricopeptide (TPR) repeat protein
LERIGQSPVKARIVTALDAWADARWFAGVPGWEGLLEAAGRADDARDGVMRKVRDAWLRRGAGRLKELASDPGVADWPPAAAVMLARTLNKAKEPEAAVRVLRAAQTRNPGDFWVNTALAAVLDGSSPTSQQETLAFTRAALATRPHSAIAHGFLANLLEIQGKPAEAEAEYRETIRLKHDLPEAHLGLGKVLAEQGKLAEAEQEWYEALRLRPDYPEAHYNLGVRLMELGKSAEAEAEYREALHLRPNYPDAHLNLGVLLGRQKKAEAAEKEYREAIRVRPDFPEAHNNLGNLLAGQNKPAEAEKEFREAIHLRPDYPDAHDNLGNLLAGQNKAAEAEKEFREAIRIKPDDPATHNNLGNLLARQNKPAEAEKEYREALRIKPDFPEAHDNLGILLKAQNKPAEAEKEYREALRIKPDFPVARWNLGRLLAEQGMPHEAEKEYREALRLEPDYYEAHFNLGGLLTGQGRAAEAEKEYLEAIRLLPDDPPAHYCLSNVLRDQGKAAEAEKEYRYAIRLKPDFPEAHCNLGHFLRDQGRFREALDELRLGHELGSRTPGWTYPSANWVADCQRVVEYDSLLPAVRGGAAAPADGDAALGFARACHRTGRHLAAVRLFATTMDAAPGPANDPRTDIRFDAACSAALAGCGQGSDAPSGDAERARLRAQALTWLRADLAAWATLARSDDANAVKAAVSKLRWWREDPDLAGVRDADALAKLPEAERDAWRQLWADVDDVLGRRC